MKQIIAIALQQIRIKFSSWSTLLFFFLLPLVFTAVVGVALGGDRSGRDPRYVYGLIVDDNGPVTETLLEHLEAAQSSRPILTTLTRAYAALDAGEINIAVVIPAGFSSAVQAGEEVNLEFIAREENQQAMIVREDVRAAAVKTEALHLAVNISLEEAERVRLFASSEDRESYAQQAMQLAEQISERPPVLLQHETGSGDSSIIAEGYQQSSPGQLVTWTLITLLGGSVAIVIERTNGTLRRLLSMPVRKGQILTGIILGRFAMGILQMLILILFGALVFNIPWGRSPAALGMVVISFALAATSLGMFLATLARSASQADGWTTLFSMLIAALGGAWWPLEITPPAYQAAVSIVPSTWAMRGFSDVILRGQGVDGVLMETLVLTGFAVLFFMLAVRRFRFE